MRRGIAGDTEQSGLGRGEEDAELTIGSVLVHFLLPSVESWMSVKYLVKPSKRGEYK